MEKILAKSSNLISRAEDKLLLLIFILMFLIGTYAMYDTYYVYSQADANKIVAYKPKEDMSELQKIAKDAVAWLTIDDTNIDYPIMQGADNFEYLNKDPFGQYSLSGSIFLDTRNNKDFTDSYNLVYGHHITGGVMFGSLDNFFKEDYFVGHKTGTLLVKNKKYPLEIFAILKTDAGESTVFDPENTEDKLEYIKKSASIYSKNATQTDRILAMSTCSETGTTDRIILFAFIRY